MPILEISSTPALMPVIFVPHGGGPLPLLGDAGHQPLIEFIRGLNPLLPRPKAIVVISAHWEAARPLISAAPTPQMIFDYSGFPPETYQYHYGAPGEPALALQIETLLNAAGLEAKLDFQRGFDHGTFVPLMLMYPEATIPVVQISLISSMEPAHQIALGKAISSLRNEGVLILGSGMSFHNMRAFMGGERNIGQRSQAFDVWLTDCLTNPNLNNADREKLLAAWTSAPEARFSHPREEHLMPLLVCFGAAYLQERPAQQVFSGLLFNTHISAFSWQ